MITKFRHITTDPISGQYLGLLLGRSEKLNPYLLSGISVHRYKDITGIEVEHSQHDGSCSFTVHREYMPVVAGIFGDYMSVRMSGLRK